MTRIDGPDLTAQDIKRLTKQLHRVLWAMEHCGTRRLSLEDIQAAIACEFGTSDPLPSISARVRDLRKRENGGYSIGHEHRNGTNLWQFWIEPRPEDAVVQGGLGI